MQSIAAGNMSYQASLSAQDIETIKAQRKVEALMPQVQNFLEDVIHDNREANKLIGMINGWSDEVVKQGELVTKLREEYGLKDDAAFDAFIGASALGERDGAAKAYIDSTVSMAAAAQRYQQRFNEAAEELIHAWDQTEKLEYKESVFNTVTTVLTMVGSMGIGGNAGVQFFTKQYADILGGTVDKVTSAIGLRGGQMLNLFNNAEKTVFGDLLAKQQGPQGLKEVLANFGQWGMDRVGFLAQRFDEWVKKYNEQPDHDSGWYIPTV
jgi:hypothetical protein